MAIGPLRITAKALSNALGNGTEATLSALEKGQGGLRPCDLDDVTFGCWIGRVDGLEQMRVREDLADYDCRNNRLAQLGLSQNGFVEEVEAAKRRYGPGRIGVFIGTSTSGIAAAEQAYRRRDPETGNLPPDFNYRATQNLFSVTEFVSRYLGIEGPAATVSTACSSSAKVFLSAYRHLMTGFCDAAVVGGVDSLCLTTLYGFKSLGLVCELPCRPWDIRRDGISIGEAAGFALLERVETVTEDDVCLLGYGESNDAYHMSAPEPEGAGAALSMRLALQSADMTPGDVDYVNLHGTATPLNDLSEDQALMQVFGESVVCSSTKGWTGHALGAAGITEAILTCLCIEKGMLPGCLNHDEHDPELAIHVLRESQSGSLRRAMSNSFGFGGSNCSLIFGRGA